MGENVAVQLVALAAIAVAAGLAAGWVGLLAFGSVLYVLNEWAEHRAFKRLEEAAGVRPKREGK